MPPWVTRQWHVLRGLKPATARIYRAHHLALRAYSQTSDGDDRDGTLKLSTANSAIIIPSSIVGTTPEDLIKHITPVEKKHLTRDRFAVFLVTPSFAPWLLDDSAFVHKALRQAYGEWFSLAKQPYTRVHALCAVVDKLPAPRTLPSLDDITSLEKEARDRAKQPPVGETGLEGIAYATLCFSDSIPSSSEPPADQAAITFVASKTSEDSAGYFSDTLRLPLANTVFQTGTPSTMIYSTWEKSKDAVDFTLKAKQQVTHHGIMIHTGAPGTKQTSALTVPLIPLTTPRQVEASMGNILRRITGPDGNSVVASQELEKVVPQFYSARGESAQATMAWALVMSKETLEPILAATNSILGRLSEDASKGSAAADAELWENLWKKHPTAFNDLVANALAAGARLHRVLSGGGGWGKKAGLLSLDPVATAQDNNSTEGSMFDGPGDLSFALQQVARDGDFIQFFISPSSGTQGGSADDIEKLKGLENLDNKWSWELGTIPSTADALPAGSWQHDAATPKETFVLRHSFGALTEAGMMISRQFKLDPNESFSLIGGSKVDVPFSRFSAVTTGLEEGIHEEAVCDPVEQA
ncbi:hypothetical protein CC80DRAFT_487779 [Byssothecium circinans]|uniref:Uncharacterized protein n=1 Tax=Byssothecium circinans TaxID=147558 RepID=A0A6A5UBI3_9PLEO|nr:hypothetical protein CC80DRAFT_487779 [Byssothecium circinans]